MANTKVATPLEVHESISAELQDAKRAILNILKYEEHLEQQERDSAKTILRRLDRFTSYRDEVLFREYPDLPQHLTQLYYSSRWEGLDSTPRIG